MTGSLAIGFCRMLSKAIVEAKQVAVQVIMLKFRFYV
jgi:hypothetical protein